MKKMVAMLLTVLLLLCAGCAPVDTGDSSRVESETAGENIASENPVVLEVGGGFGEIDLAEYAGREPMSAASLTREQRMVIEIAKIHYSESITVSVPPTKGEVFDFFFEHVNSSYYPDLEKWNTGDRYEIPLSESERILCTYLNIDKVDVEAVFSEQAGQSHGDSCYYDMENACYVMERRTFSRIGAALEPLVYTITPGEEEGGEYHHILLGSYDPLKYHPPATREYELIGIYEVIYWIPDHQPENYKLLFAHETVPEVPEPLEPLTSCDAAAEEYCRKYVEIWDTQAPFREDFSEEKPPEEYTVAWLFCTCYALEFDEWVPESEDFSYPAEMVETVISQYFPITAEQLRVHTGKMGRERYQDGYYYMDSGVVGDGGYSIVTDYEQTGDILKLHCSYLHHDSHDPFMKVVMTIRLSEDGGFTYLSNEVVERDADFTEVALQ